MLRNRFIKSSICLWYKWWNEIYFEIDFENSSSSSSFWSDDENNDDFEQEEYPYYALDGVKTRIVWVTNYINNEDCMYITLF
jgi:hypothetical protein